MSKFTPIVLALSLLTAAGAPMQAAMAQAAAQSAAQPAAQPAAAAQTVTPVPGQAPEAVLEKATGADAMGDEPVQSYEDWVAEFEEQFGQGMGQAQDGRVFYAGFAPLSADSAANPHYGTQLALAYERAMFDMQADYILSTYGRLTTQMILTRFEDQSSNKDVFDPVELEAAVKAGGGRLEALVDKALTLLDKKLDNALVEEGVPAEDVKKMTVEQKKTLFKDNLSKSVTKSAYQNMQGLVPVQTRIFSQTENGKKAMIVAVIAVQSEKTRQFAQDIARKRPTLVKGSPKALKDLLPANQKGYLNEIGLRFTYDEAGRPMLLSYGRASVPMDPSWSASRAIRAKKSAQDIAQSVAESNIVAFMNNNIRISESTETGDVNEDLARQVTEIQNGKVGQSQQTKEHVAETLQKWSSNGTATASGELRGTSVLKRWATQDDNGVEHVGTVVAWTYGQLDNANAIDAQRRGQSNGAQQNGATSTATDQNRSSKAINSKHDF